MGSSLMIFTIKVDVWLADGANMKKVLFLLKIALFYVNPTVFILKDGFLRYVFEIGIITCTNWVNLHEIAEKITFFSSQFEKCS